MVAVQGIHMGEGVCGRNDLAAQTSQLYSCMGITIVNRTNQRGGIYHYPANQITNRNVYSTLRRMFQVIMPDEVVITPAETGPVLGIGSTQADLNDVQNFLASELNPNVIVRVAPPNVSAILYWQNGNPITNARQFPGVAVRSVQVGERVRSQMSTAPRVLDGTTFYFGGDGEVGPNGRPGTLDQGIRGAQAGSPAQQPGRLARMRNRVRLRLRF